jgi:biopolymer transport protein ExbD
MPQHPAGTAARRARLVHKRPVKLDSVRSEINVTPLVDVCLVLLIIFMIITELLSRGKEVPLPETSHHQTQNDEDQPIVAMDKEGKIYFDKDEVPNYAALKKRVEDEWRAKGQTNRRIFVKADVDLPYGKVYPLIMAMHELGVPGIDLGTNEKKEKK